MQLPRNSLSGTSWRQSAKRPGKRFAAVTPIGPPATMHRVRRAILLLGCLVALSANWCSPGFAQRQAAVGPSNNIPLLPTGVANGVDMSGSATTGTLQVGVLGGPETDIFSTNTSLTSPLLAVSTAASSQGSITFNSSSTVYGGIGVTPPGGPFVLDISAGSANTVVNFQGPVFATTTFITGTGTLNFNSGSINQSPNGLIFDGDGIIGLAPNTTVVGALTTAAGTNTGTLNLGGGSVLNGAVGAASASLRAVNVVGGSATSGVSATVTGAVHAYSISLGTNTLNIGGALTIADNATSGVINTTLASSTLYGNIRPVGFTSLGATLGVNVTVPSSAVFPVGTQFNIVQSQAGTAQSGTAGTVLHITVVDPTNPLYTFSAVPVTGTNAGLVAITTTGIPLLVPLQPPVLPPVIQPVVPIAAPVVPPLLALLPTASPGTDISNVLASLDALSEPATVVLAIAQLAPSASDLAAPQVAFQGTREFENLWMSHLDEVMCGQISQPDRPGQPNLEPATCHGTNDQHGGMWLKGFGYFGEQGSQPASPGYTSDIFGTMIGYDAPLPLGASGGQTRIGFGIGYARSNIAGKLFGDSTDFNTYQATAYIGHQQGPWFVDGDLALGWSDYDETRNISYPGFTRTAKGSYGGQNYTAFLTTGYHFFTRGVTITPVASLQYTHLNMGSYTETGADSVDLNVHSQHYDFLESSLGLKLARPFVYREGTYVPEIHANWLHELSNPTSRNVATFSVAGSPPFSTPGLKAADNTLNIGAGITFLSCTCTAKTWSLAGVYDFYWRADNYVANQVMLRLAVRF